jgi:hypothetical protein
MFDLQASTQATDHFCQSVPSSQHTAPLPKPTATALPPTTAVPLSDLCTGHDSVDALPTDFDDAVLRQLVALLETAARRSLTPHD